MIMINFIIRQHNIRGSTTVRGSEKSRECGSMPNESMRTDPFLIEDKTPQFVGTPNSGRVVKGRMITVKVS